MTGVFLIALVALSSALAFLLLLWRRAPRLRHLRSAVASALGCLGTIVAVYCANVSVGMAIVLSIRSFGGWFMSLYVVGDPTLLALSLLEGLVLHFLADRTRHVASSKES